MEGEGVLELRHANLGGLSFAGCFVVQGRGGSMFWRLHRTPAFADFKSYKILSCGLKFSVELQGLGPKTLKPGGEAPIPNSLNSSRQAPIAEESPFLRVWVEGFRS